MIAPDIMTSVLRTAGEGFQLSIDFSRVANVSHELRSLTRTITKFSLLLRQATGLLQKPTSVGSVKAGQALGRIATCGAKVLDELDDRLDDAQDEIDRGDGSRSETQEAVDIYFDEHRINYLLALLNSLELSLALLIQTIQLGDKLAVEQRTSDAEQQSINQVAIAAERIVAQDLIYVRQLQTVEVDRSFEVVQRAAEQYRSRASSPAGDQVDNVIDDHRLELYLLGDLETNLQRLFDTEDTMAVVSEMVLLQLLGDWTTLSDIVPEAKPNTGASRPAYTSDNVSQATPPNSDRYSSLSTSHSQHRRPSSSYRNDPSDDERAHHQRLSQSYSRRSSLSSFESGSDRPSYSHRHPSARPHHRIERDDSVSVDSEDDDIRTSTRPSRRPSKTKPGRGHSSDKDDKKVSKSKTKDDKDDGEKDNKDDGKKDDKKDGKNDEKKDDDKDDRKTSAFSSINPLSALLFPALLKAIMPEEDKKEDAPAGQTSNYLPGLSLPISVGVATKGSQNITSTPAAASGATPSATPAATPAAVSTTAPGQVPLPSPHLSPQTAGQGVSHGAVQPGATTQVRPQRFASTAPGQPQQNFASPVASASPHSASSQRSSAASRYTPQSAGYPARASSSHVDGGSFSAPQSAAPAGHVQYANGDRYRQQSRPIELASPPRDRYRPDANLQYRPHMDPASSQYYSHGPSSRPVNAPGPTSPYHQSHYPSNVSPVSQHASIAGTSPGHPSSQQHYGGRPSNQDLLSPPNSGQRRYSLPSNRIESSSPHHSQSASPRPQFSPPRGYHRHYSPYDEDRDRRHASQDQLYDRSHSQDRRYGRSPSRNHRSERRSSQRPASRPASRLDSPPRRTTQRPKYKYKPSATKLNVKPPNARTSGRMLGAVKLNSSLLKGLSALGKSLPRR